jgi:hypothetical protein
MKKSIKQGKEVKVIVGVRVRVSWGDIGGHGRFLKK